MRVCSVGTAFVTELRLVLDGDDKGGGSCGCARAVLCCTVLLALAMDVE